MAIDEKQKLRGLSDNIQGLLAATSQLEKDAPKRSELDAIVARGVFRPAEDEAIGFWFARFLSMRESLRTSIDDVRAILDQPKHSADQEHGLQYFLVGYAAVCLLIRIDRVMLFEVAYHSVIQRKLNESFPEYRIPRKQYTEIYSAFVDPKNAFAIREAMTYFKKNRRRLLRLRTDENVGFVAQQISELALSLNASKRSYVRRAWHFLSHKWRRRGAVSTTNLFFGVMEAIGRTTSEFYDSRNKGVTEHVLADIANFMRPGDIIITRHRKALTNLFLPGFWPHAALYVGTSKQRVAAQIKVEPAKEHRWVDDICILEARKDGVLLRSLRETLSVDVFVVLRPNIDPDSICRAVERALMHEGKEYNFDFDFFNSDRVVCTELVYRSYDGLDDLEIPLQERGGRRTLSAEDLLDFAMDTGAFTPVAIFGVKGCEQVTVFGDSVRDILKESYRRSS